MQKAMPKSASILIGDCSGGFPVFERSPSVRVFPLLNHPHGVKLDFLMQRVCCAPYVLVADDDVFWFSEQPLQWALAQFAADPKVAVVSFMPRDTVSDVMYGKVAQPMGSFCLLIRREIWIKEGLSFRIVQPSVDEGYGWFYDTGDFANVELLKRGFRVVIAAPEYRGDLCCLEAISTWTLKLQERKGDLRRSIGDVTLRRSKALRAILTLRCLDQLLAKWFPHMAITDTVKRSYLDRAQAFCLGGMARDEVSSIESQVESVFHQIEQRLRLVEAQ
jgi:hypothetical protein